MPKWPTENGGHEMPEKKRTAEKGPRENAQQNGQQGKWTAEHMADGE